MPASFAKNASQTFAPYPRRATWPLLLLALLIAAATPPTTAAVIASAEAEVQARSDVFTFDWRLDPLGTAEQISQYIRRMFQDRDGNI